jgi:membrane protease YdiL (CAAX protease family)
MRSMVNGVLPAAPEPVSPLPPPKRVWGGWATAGFGAIVFIVFVVVQTVVVVIAALALALSHSSLVPGLQPGNIASSIMDLLTGRLGLLQSFATILSGIVGIGLIILFIRLRARAGTLEYLGLNRLTARGALVAVGIIIAFYAMSIGVNVWLGLGEKEQLMYDIYATSVWPALFWIAVVVFAPAFEEVFFRGFLLEGFRQSRLGAAGAVIITSAAWAALHALQYSLVNVVWILVLGIVMGIVRLRTKSLWNTIIMHMLVNIVGMLEIALNLDKFFTK